MTYRRYMRNCGVGLLFAALSLGLQADPNALPKLKVNKKPLAADLKQRTSFAPMIKRVAPSVVTIQAEHAPKVQDPAMMLEEQHRKLFRKDESDGPGSMPSLGSGVIMTADGYILTNNHVVRDASRIKVLLSTRKRYSAQLIGTDPKTDVAVLKIETPTKLPAIRIADSSIIEVGDMCFAFGNPFGVGQTVTRGMVSALSRGNLKITAYDNFIQTDAAINRGNSGGALVDAEGRLTGINTAIVSSTGGSQGIGLAIPINQAIRVMMSIIRDGKVIRGFLGVTVDDVTPEQVKFYGLKGPDGAFVTFVTPESPADKAGIKKGDIVQSYGAETIRDSQQLRRLVGQTKPGEQVDIMYLRGGKEVALKILLDKKAEPEKPDDKPKIPSMGVILRGVKVVDLKPKIRNMLKVPAEIDGVLVEVVDPDSPAHRDGLQPGDLLLEINREPVKSAANAQRLAQNAKGKSVLLFIWRKGRGSFLAVKRRL